MTVYEARQRVEAVVPPKDVLAHVGSFGGAHTFAVAPSQRAVVSAKGDVLLVPAERK